MKYNQLNIKSHKQSDRVGRGIAAGQGKTAGRGTKGQKSRTGYRAKPGFEGGQTPLMLRLPKLHGFRSIHSKAEVIYTGQLDLLGERIDTTILADKHLISSPYVRVKLIVKGSVTKKHSVHLPAASAAAIAALKKSGGSFTATHRVGRVAAKDSNADKP